MFNQVIMSQNEIRLCHFMSVSFWRLFVGDKSVQK